MNDWHPILTAEERTPGKWTMLTPDGEQYGVVEIRRTADGIRYRCAFRGAELIPTTSLRDACARVHRAYIATLSPGPPPGGIYPNLRGDTPVDRKLGYE